MRRSRSNNNLLDSNSRRWIRIACGCILLVSGIAGFAHSLRTAVAQAWYHRTKSIIYEGTKYERLPPTDPLTVLQTCEKAIDWYPANYYLADQASIRGLEGALEADNPEDFSRCFGAAEYWNKVSIAINPYNIDAMYIRARILVERGEAAAAADFWRDTVLERSYWNDDFQEYYVQLLLAAGLETRAIAASSILRHGALKKKMNLIQQKRDRPTPDKK